MIFPYAVDVPMKRMPIANWALMAATAVIGFPTWSNLEAYYDNHEAGFLILGRGDEFAWHQLLGSLFGHADPVHLIGNMWALFLYGNAVNARLGHVAFLLLYFGIGILDGLIWLGVGSGELTLGASGAVMGIIGCFVVLYPRNDVSVFYWLFLVKMGTWRISAYIVIGIYILLDFIGLLGSGGVVNHLAHLAGAGLGIGAMMAGAGVGVVKPDPGEQTMVDLFRARSAKTQRPEYRPRDVGTPGSTKAPIPPRPVRQRDLPPIPLAGDEPTPPN